MTEILVWGWRRCCCGECRTCGSDSVFSAAVVLGMRGVGGVCQMCMCLVRGVVEG